MTKFPSAASSSEEVRNATASLAEFIKGRTGITITESTKARLNLLEETASKTGAGGISANKLSRILTNWIIDRAASLTDDELLSAENSFRGFITPELAANPPPKLAELGRRKNLLLRASILVHESHAIPLLKSIRDRAAAGDETLRQQAYDLVRDEVRKQITVLSEAAPDFFSGTSSDMAEARLTPLRSFLIAYAVVSDDRLTHNQASLEKEMRAHWEGVIKHGGGGYFPPPEGQHAYGPNGYLYSSPLDLFFNEPSLGRLLAAIGRGRRL